MLRPVARGGPAGRCAMRVRVRRHILGTSATAQIGTDEDRTTRGRSVSCSRPGAGGDLQAREDLIPLVYRSFGKRAAAYLRRERQDHTLQPTALVNEAYMRLMGQRRVTWLNRAQFFGVAAQIMRRILIDHAREREAAKRPGGVRITLDEGIRSRAAGRLRAADARRRAARTRADRRASGAHRGAGTRRALEDEVAAVLSLSRATITREWQSRGRGCIAA